jgi:DNA-binding PucR family transcriptional regulator
MRKELDTVKKAREPKSLEVFESRLEFIESEMDALLEKTGRKTVVEDVRASTKDLTSKQEKILESLKELSNQQERIIETLTAFGQEKEEIKAAVEKMQDDMLKKGFKTRRGEVEE